MSTKIRTLTARKAEQVKSARALTDKVASEGRDFTAAEQAEFEGFTAQISTLNAQIEREQLLAAEEAGMNAAGGVEISAASTLTVTENVAADPKRGFASFGEFAKSVISASNDPTRMDKRLLIGAAAPGTAGNEGAGADGGFVVPPQYSKDVFKLSLGEDALIDLTDNIDVSSNSMVFPKTEQTPWGTNGVRAYWQAEASAATATKPTIGTQALRLHKLMALVPLTDELVADTTALDSLVPGLVADSIRWKTNEAILFGSGNGQPLGALTSSSPVITQVKDAGQATSTLSALNLFNMISRLPQGSFGKAVWLIHPTVIPALATLVLGNIPVFVPAAPAAQGALTQGVSFGYILGRPCIISQHCSAFSNAGDVQLLDLTYYRTITKAGGVQTATSLHLYFDADAVALRSTFRVDGSPKIATLISPAKGATTLSPFVQLGAR